MPDNTMFHIKAGTTYAYPTGGFIYMKDYYQSFRTNIGFFADNTWGAGSTATMDFAGTTNSQNGSIFIQTEGIHMTNINFLNAPWASIHLKAYGNGGKTGNFIFDHCNSTNHGAGIAFGSDWVTGSSEAGFVVLNCTNVLFESCVADSTNALNGFIVGDVHLNAANVTFSDCKAYHHYGDPSLGAGHDDLGIGFKAIYSIALYTNCVSQNNQKGFDLGSHGDGLEMRYTVINSTAKGNTGWGINMVGQGESSSGPAPGVSYPTNSFNYQINNLIVSNGVAGTRSYGSCQFLHLLSNLYDGNGWNTNASGSLGGSQVTFNPDDFGIGSGDGVGPITLRMYNNIFIHAAGAYTYIDFANVPNTNIFTVDSDYNAIIQQSSEQFAEWDQFGWGGVAEQYSFGVNGPGHGSGNWFAHYQNTTSNLQPRGGTGHHNSDAHSRGTGAADTTAPPIDPITYIPTNHYFGSDISTQTWYVASIMSRDRLGNNRSWDVGPYAYVSDPAITVQPTDQTVTTPAAATFSVTATGTAPITYQWQWQGTNVTGATGSSWTTPTLSASGSTSVDCVVTSGVGSLTSSAATLMVNAALISGGGGLKTYGKGTHGKSTR